MSPSDKRRLTWQGGTFPAQTAGGGAGHCGAFRAAGADTGSAASGSSGTHSHTVQAETIQTQKETHYPSPYYSQAHISHKTHIIILLTTAKLTLVTKPTLSFSLSFIAARLTLVTIPTLSVSLKFYCSQAHISHKTHIIILP